MLPNDNPQATEVARSIPKHCRATRKDGQPCAAPVLGAGDYCFAHDPRRKAERDAARQAGGAARANVRRLDRLVPHRLRPVLEQLLAALRDVRSGKLAPAQATAMAALAGAVVRVYGVAQLEQRVEELEAAMPLERFEEE